MVRDYSYFRRTYNPGMKIARRSSYVAQARERRLAHQEAGRIVARAASVASRLKKGSSHFVDLASANYNNDTTGSIVLVATIPQNTTQSGRVGKKAKYKSFQIRGVIQNNSTGTQNEAAVLLVYDKRPGGALPAITDILNTVSQRSFNNDVNSSRFRIIMRRDYILNGTAATSIGTGPGQLVDEYVKCALPIEFGNGGTGQITDIELGAVYLVTVGIAAAGLTAATTTVGIRTRFHDTEG